MISLPLLEAHETWFERAPGSMDWSFAGEGTTLALLAAALLVTALVRAVARVWPGVDVPFLARMAPFMPFAIRLHVGVSLIGLLSLGVYLSPRWISSRISRASRSARRWSCRPCS